MKAFNNNEMDFQEKLQKDTEIPVIVHERINQAYRMIENDTAIQKKTPKDPYHWMIRHFQRRKPEQKAVHRLLTWI